MSTLQDGREEPANASDPYSRGRKMRTEAIDLKAHQEGIDDPLLVGVTLTTHL